jgi:hypothetical protein
MYLTPQVGLIHDVIRAKNIAENRREDQACKEGLEGQPHKFSHTVSTALFSGVVGEGVKA